MNFRGDIYIENGIIIDLKKNESLCIHTIDDGKVQVNNYSDYSAYP